MASASKSIPFVVSAQLIVAIKLTTHLQLELFPPVRILETARAVRMVRA
jgi:hypothetical protein